MPMNQDNKIREYVMKKQQQRERAQFLRSQRRNTTNNHNNNNNNNSMNSNKNYKMNQNHGYNQTTSFSSQKRIIGDPFAPPSYAQNENIDNSNVRSLNDNNNNNNGSQYGNSETYKNNNNNPYNNNNNEYYNNNNNRRDRIDRTDNRYENNATAFGKMSSSDVFSENQNNINEQYTDQYNNYNNNNNNKWQTPLNNNNNNKKNTNKNINNYTPGFSNRNNNNFQPINNEARDRERERERELNVEKSISTKQFATACDVQKVLSMVEQLRGQMHALQFQIDNLKIENTKLKQQIVTFEKQKTLVQTQQQQTYYSSHNNNNNNNNNNNFSKSKSLSSSTMDIDHDMNNANSMRMSQNLRNLKIKQHNNMNQNMNILNNNNYLNNNNFNGFNNETEETEISAPPKSSAADLLAKLESTEGAFVDIESVQRIECRQCGRKFSHTALQKHIKICKKVFGQKRKKFNMQQQRTDDEALKAARNSDSQQIEAELKRKKIASKQKWKSQSSMLREAIRNSKVIEDALKSGKSLADIPNIPSSVPDCRIPCPHCGRKFAEETAKRHIPKCQNIKSRPKALKRRR